MRRPLAPFLVALILAAGRLSGQCSLFTNCPTMPAGGGSSGVTSIDLALPTWLTASGVPLTGPGTITVSGASGLTTGRVVGTCGGATALALCPLGVADVPDLWNQTFAGDGRVEFAGGGGLNMIIDSGDFDIELDGANKTIGLQSYGGNISMVASGATGSNGYILFAPTSGMKVNEIALPSCASGQQNRFYTRTSDHAFCYCNGTSLQCLPTTAAAVTANFLTAYDSTTGAFARARPACSSLSDAAASCATDTTVAANIGGGTASRCARFDSTGHLVAASGDCAAGDTTGGPSTYAGSASAAGPATTALATTSSAGVAATVTTTAAAATASTTAGVGLTITADPAVAGTTNAGAAKGGDVNITAGNAARLTSGNANGGAINLTTGTGIGTGTAGNVVISNNSIALGPNGPGGTLISNSGGSTYFVFPDAPTQWSTIASAAHRIAYQTAGGNASISLIPSNGGNGTYVSIFDAGGGPCLKFSASTNAETNLDASVCRGAGKVVTFGDGGANANGWPQWAGSRQLSANGTNATATLANSGISISVTIGRKYSFQCYLRVANSVAAEGMQVDFGGGTVTATDFRAEVTLTDSTLLKAQQVTSLSTAVSVATFTGDGEIAIHGSLEPGSSGTFIPRFAEATHTTGTATIYRGSNCVMQEGI